MMASKCLPAPSPSPNSTFSPWEASRASKAPRVLEARFRALAKSWMLVMVAVFVAAS